MSLRHGLLGLLAEGPASGYDLAGRFQEALGSVWPAQHPQIYAELGRLADAGLIEVESVGARGRKAYRITPSGLAEVRRWLREGDVDRTFRVEVLMRAFFFWLMEPEDLDAFLVAEERYFDETAKAFRQYADRKDRGEFGTGPQTRALRIAAEAGIRVNEALAEWARWARETDLMSSTEFGTGGGSQDGAEGGQAAGGA
ncbi:PadR family transcriptional regulator [Actinospica robiniae]|uniref:PadR family transcriptional regulator n=1 Tax=Actinospica robiniae TaxID=304901 RepID=UPI000413D635|nr:PadR family transcriptional regulator [Actinospica robiniae]